MIRRCAGCGSFFDAEECPNDHAEIPVFVPPPVVTDEVKRCAGCGSFFTGEACPHDHSHIKDWQPPPLTKPLPGRIVQYGGDVCVIVSPADENGCVGLAILHERVRANLHDLKEIH